MNETPAWRVWLVTALCAGWAILALASVRGGKWPVAAICVVLLAANLLTLYRLTRRDRPGR
ncbi:hypothetical protein [Deinococcus sonorensis]|uniref:Uncharacterized protein n=2 Tax=Deinococcus sonorensis TaxID=309891 RepID=A0AAU7U956_9DEIO